MKDLDTELSESFMAQKVAQLVGRQKDKECARAKSFSLTDQFTVEGTTGKEEDEQQHHQTLTQPPDNFDIVAADALAGTYFKEKTQRSSVARLAPLEPEAHAEDRPQHQTGSFKKIRLSTTSAGGTSTRKTPAERKQELDEMVHQQMLRSLAEQEEDDHRRREACAIQRQVERLKMQQRVKARIERQLASSQRPFDRSLVDMGLDVDKILAEKPKTATQTAVHRASLLDEPNRTFVQYNMTRMQYNLAHRQYCIETVQDRQRVRMAMERSVHAYYPAKKVEQLRAIGAGDDMACRFPTVAEQHAKQVAVLNEATKIALESEQRDEQLNEMTGKDEELWVERREHKGQRAERLRDVPYDIHKPYVHHRDMKPAHLPVLLHTTDDSASASEKKGVGVNQNTIVS